MLALDRRPAALIAAPPPARRVETGVAHLALTAFRGFRHVELELEPGLVVLTGPNGGGKTNLLEALSYLAPGNGLRQAPIADVALRQKGNRGEEAAGERVAAAPLPAWAVHARYLGQGGAHELGTGRDPLAPAQIGRERRLVRINGASARSQAAFAEILAVHWLTPQMDRLFEEAPASRRRFLDRLAAGEDAAHAARLASFDESRRQRLCLLRGEGPAATASALAAWLDALEARMAEDSIAIGAARLETAAQLNEAMAMSAGPFPRAHLAVVGAVEDWLRAMPAVAAEEKLQEALRAARAGDADAGATQWGAHRGDLAVAFAGRRLGDAPLAAADCSGGEQKALLVAVLLAAARLATRRRGEPPLLLLDEVAARLDPARRLALFEEILALGAPCWLTGTESETFRPLREAAQFFAAAEGRVARER